jgi:hypothetical protein
MSGERGPLRSSRRLGQSSRMSMRLPHFARIRGKTAAGVGFEPTERLAALSGFQDETGVLPDNGNVQQFQLARTAARDPVRDRQAEFCEFCEAPTRARQHMGPPGLAGRVSRDRNFRPRVNCVQPQFAAWPRECRLYGASRGFAAAPVTLTSAWACDRTSDSTHDSTSHATGRNCRPNPLGCARNSR